MPEISYFELESYLADDRQRESFKIFFFYGEPYLYSQASGRIISAILSKKERDSALEAIEGIEENIPELMERLATSSLFSEKKLILFHDTLFNISEKGDESEKMWNLLSDVVEKGFGEGHILMITTASVDRRRALFKAVKKKGLIIDCSVPAGNRLADRKLKDRLLLFEAERILRECGKRLEPAGFNAMKELIGFDLYTFKNSLESLIQYAGKNDTITRDDVLSLLDRSKEDPVYEFTGAVAAKDLEGALFFLHSLMNNRYHPLQIITALANQVRALLLMRAFIDSERGLEGLKNISYQEFKVSLLPEIVARDDEVKRRIKESGYPGKKESPKIEEIIIAKNPKNSYPVYQLFRNACRFSKKGLIEAMNLLSEADYSLKTSAGLPDSILENLVLEITA